MTRRLRTWQQGLQDMRDAGASWTDFDLGWACGFIDGEGWLHMKGRSPRIHVTQRQREPLDKLMSMFGGSIRKVHRAAYKGGFIWEWSIHGARALAIMYLLYLHLSPRRQAKIREIIEIRSATNLPPASTGQRPDTRGGEDLTERAALAVV